MGWLRNFLGGEAGESSAAHPPLPEGAGDFLPGGMARGFHASAVVRGVAPETGEIIFRSGAGASLQSQAEAEAQARAHAELHLATALAGTSSQRDTYAYAIDRAVEPVVSDLPFAGGSAGRLTINSYGALIINARAAFFADVDTRTEDTAPPDPAADETAAARLRDVIAREPDLSFRVYRTHNGWRYLCTSRPFDPAAAETQQLLEDLGVDRRYRVLCRVQRCFRARVTPKPWRIGQRFPEVHPTQTVSRRHLERYLRRGAGFASAAFVDAAGRSAAPSPEIAAVVSCHDDWCAALSGRPLA